MSKSTLQGVEVIGCTSDGNKEAVVLLHSSLSSNKQWRPLINKLSDNFIIININLLGYGDAPKVEFEQEYSLGVETDRVLAIIDETIKDNTFHLVGHSFGGACALKLAIENSKRLLSLSLYEPVAFHLFAPGSELKAQVMDFVDKVAHLEKIDAVRVFIDTWNGNGFFADLPEKIQQQMASDIDKVNLDFIGLLGESYSAEDCSAITCPVSLIHGALSPSISREIISRLVVCIPDVIEYEVNAGHMAPISHPNEVANIIVTAILD